LPRISKIFRVLIASPSDVSEERRILYEIINTWNSTNSISYGLFLEPVGWEISVYPEFNSDGGQAVINKQIVMNSDILVGTFWSKLGTPTKKHPSGTVEEIHQFIKRNKPALIFFSQRPIPPDDLDRKQYERLKSFKGFCSEKGIYSTYSTLEEYKEKVIRSITLLISNITTKQSSEVDSYFETGIDNSLKQLRGRGRISLDFDIVDESVKLHLVIFRPITEDDDDPFGAWRATHDVVLDNYHIIKKRKILKMMKSLGCSYKFYLNVPNTKKMINKYYAILSNAKMVITGKGSMDPDNKNRWKIWFLCSDDPIHPATKDPWRLVHSLVDLQIF